MDWIEEWIIGAEGDHKFETTYIVDPARHRHEYSVIAEVCQQSYKKQNINAVYSRPLQYFVRIWHAT